MNIIIKKQKLENPGDRIHSRIQIERSTTWANPLVHWFYWPIFSLFPRELQLAMNIIYWRKKQNWRIRVSIPVQLEMNIIIKKLGIDPGDSRIQIERSTTWANPLVHCFYWPIFSLFPRELQLAMNIIRKKGKLENPGIDPGASRIQIERSTT